MSNMLAHPHHDCVRYRTHYFLDCEAMKFNRKRRGIPFLTDFYAFTVLWDRSPSFLAEEFLLFTKQVLLHDISLCVFSELSHIHDRSSFRGQSQFERRKHPRENIRKLGGYEPYYRLAHHHFADYEWLRNYGGNAWALICDRALRLIKTKEVLNAIPVLDNLIDSSHNCGRCLDKLYPFVDGFLTKKTEDKSSEWILEQSQPYIHYQFGRYS